MACFYHVYYIIIVVIIIIAFSNLHCSLHSRIYVYIILRLFSRRFYPNQTTMSALDK